MTVHGRRQRATPRWPEDSQQGSRGACWSRRDSLSNWGAGASAADRAEAYNFCKASHPQKERLTSARMLATQNGDPVRGPARQGELTRSLWERPHEAEGQEDGASPAMEAAPLFLPRCGLQRAWVGTSRQARSGGGRPAGPRHASQGLGRSVPRWVERNPCVTARGALSSRGLEAARQQ